MGETLKGSVAVITGGASGIGRATALRFLDEGASVVIADVNEATAVEAVGLAEARGAKGRIRFARTDVSQEDDVRAAIELAVSAFGRLDCVFNNAGIGGAFGSVLETHVEDWDASFAVLVRGVFLGIKHGGRVMKRQGQGGSIINTASVAGFSGGGSTLVYSTCKAAVINLSRAAAVELAPDRIRVNAICPGGILTPMIQRGADEEHAIALLKSMQPWPDHGRPEHVASAALFLASREGEFVTGEALVVDGGMHAAGPGLMSRPEARAATAFVGLDQGSTGKPPIVRNQS